MDVEREAENLIVHMVNTPCETYKAKLADWLAAHDRRVRAQALRDAAEAIGDYPYERQRINSWLRRRADEIELEK